MRALRVRAKGIACDGVVVMASDIDARVLAHEIGHALGLVDHQESVPSIMNAQEMEASLTPSMTRQARMAAKRLFPNTLSAVQREMVKRLQALGQQRHDLATSALEAKLGQVWRACVRVSS